MGSSEYTARRRRRNGVPPRDEALLCGIHPVLEQLRSDPKRVRRILVARGAERGAARILEAADAAGVRVVIEDRRRLEQRAGEVVHQGVAAEIEPFAYADFQDLVARQPERLLVADQVTDPRNLGALMRSAEAAGMGGVVIPEHRSAGVTEVVAKASAGASAWIPVARVTNVSQALQALKDAGYWVVGLDAERGDDMFGFTFPVRCVLVVGSEGKGLRPLVRSTCDHLIAIPMVGRVASLNVSVAGAIACYEALRQRHRIDSRKPR